MPQQIPPQFRLKKLTAFPYPIAGAQAVAAPASIPVELTKYAQTDYFSRLLIQVSGNVIVAGAGPGVATGRDNPESTLLSVMFQTTPSLNGVTPVNNVSARGLLIDNQYMRGYIRRATAIPDTAGTQPVNIVYEIYFKRPYVRKGAEWDFAIAKFTSALLTLQFGGREQLFTGGTNTWDMSGLTVGIFADSDLNLNAERIHNHELFERTYPITATQVDFPIDTLPQGFLYSDLTFIAEVANARSNALIQNINLEGGGGRVWLPAGDNNASVLQLTFSEYRGVISDPSYDPTGIYPIPLRDGMYTRAIDSLASPITIKLNVTFTGGQTNLVRLLGRRMVPGQLQKSNPKLR